MSDTSTGNDPDGAPDEPTAGDEVPTTTGPVQPGRHKRSAPRVGLNTQPSPVQRAAPRPRSSGSPSAPALPTAPPATPPPPVPDAVVPPPAPEPVLGGSPPPDDGTAAGRPPRPSFLASDDDRLPPTRGWRSTAARLGIRVQPSADELAERADMRAVSRPLPGPRTVAIVNGKGGANKTPTTALLAAVFARFGGAGVLAWDNNETRGTLGWRTEQGSHDATVHDLLPHAAALLAPAAGASDLARYVHHQQEDKYDVLRSNPRVLANQQRITRAEFDALHQVAQKYYRLLFLDSGNDESAERWQQMIERADHLVIATTALGEHAEAGALLLEQLAERDARSAALARLATVIVSQSDPDLGHGDAREVAARFRGLARAAVTIPFDDALHSGRIRYDALAPRTRRAWLRAAALVADAMQDQP